MSNILKVAIDAAQAGGQIIQAGTARRDSLKIEQKSLHDYVSEIDRNSEKVIKAHILANFPEHQIIGEEYGRHKGTENTAWVIDPLDGTTNFLRGIPHYAVSIGVLIDDVLEHAVVFDPAKNELFTASRGNGAYLNRAAIQATKVESSRGGLYATGVPFSGDNFASIESFTETMVGVLNYQTSGIRRLGSAALDLAYVAAGRYDGYWEANLQVWDIAAGVLLVQESGGTVSDLHGGQQYLNSGNILANARGAHADLLQVTSSCYPLRS